MVFLSQVRASFLHVLYALKELVFIIANLFFFMFIMAGLGYFYNHGSAEGVYYMSDLRETNWSLNILLTTANFPDVMLPAYNESWRGAIFFIVFITLGLYFWLNLILASVFNVFKQRIATKDQVSRDKRQQRIIASINKFTADKNDEFLDY